MRTPPAWPALPLSKWLQARDTLQLWLQIVGKVRLQNTPLISHWWNVPLHLTARGLTTSLMQHPNGDSFEIDIDFHEHRLAITTVSGRRVVTLGVALASVGGRPTPWRGAP